MENLVLLCFHILCVSMIVKSQDKIPTLDLNDQSVEVHGVIETVPFGGVNYTFYKYLGIPFAEPPVGELRFRKPEPVRQMDSPFQANEQNLPCVQFNFDHKFEQSEDCLYLNIYKPGRASDSAAGHAVGIWVHGGGFTQGSGSQYDATFLSLYGNVIVVTINYRLGPYGFLSTGDDNAPGNYAFWDQRMAFQWVHDNIDRFGGDKQRVTIFGESAGAISVSHQGLITLNKGLFQRIIAQSGSAFIPSDPKCDLNPIKDAKELGSALGCDVTQPKALMVCLRGQSNEEIKNVMIKNEISPSKYGYVLDNVLIKRDAMTIPFIGNKQKLEEVDFYRSLDVMNGFNSHEGMFITDYITNDSDLLLSRGQMKTTIRHILGFLTGHPVEESVLEMVMGEYTNWTNPDSKEEVRLQLVKLFGDFVFGGPAIETALMHALSPGATSNYVYHFIANPPFGPLPAPQWLPGANHADEIPFVFGVEMFMPGKDPSTTWEIQLSRKMVTYWSNFMKTGDPNKLAPVSPAWPAYDVKSQSYLKLEENTTDKSVGHFLYAKEHNFWTNVFPRINKAVGKMSEGGMDFVSSDGSYVSSMLVPLFITFIGLFIML